MKKAIHIFYCSKLQSLYGLTEDRTGSNLPKENCSGVWEYRETINVSPMDPSLVSGIKPSDILIAIDNNGYYLQNIVIVFEEKIEPSR